MRIKWHKVDNPPLASLLIWTGANKWHLQRKWWGDRRSSVTHTWQRGSIWGDICVMPKSSCTFHPFALRHLSGTYDVSATVSSAGDTEIFLKSIFDLVKPTVLWRQQTNWNLQHNAAGTMLVGWREPRGLSESHAEPGWDGKSLRK